MDDKTNVAYLGVDTTPIDWDLKALNHVNSIYTQEQKVGVMTHFLMNGRLDKAAAAFDVPYQNVRDWHTRADWWESEFEKIRTAKQEELDAVFTTTLHDCMGMLKDRLITGDSVIDKNNEIRQLPVKAKELAIIGAVIFDKRQLLRGNATRISGSTTTLNDLEEKFKQFSDKLTKKD